MSISRAKGLKYFTQYSWVQQYTVIAGDSCTPKQSNPGNAKVERRIHCGDNIPKFCEANHVM